MKIKRFSGEENLRINRDLSVGTYITVTFPETVLERPEIVIILMLFSDCVRFCGSHHPCI